MSTLLEDFLRRKIGLNLRRDEAWENGLPAPLGWYKVTLITTLPGTPEIAVAARYLDAVQTPWSKEVVADPPPDHYDLVVNP